MICFLRHTSVSNPSNLCYGRFNIPLSETYHLELNKLRSKIGQDWNKVYSSPSERCLRLATDLTNLEPIEDARLQEMDFGLWEGRSWYDLPRQETERWTKDIVRSSPPGGESYQSLAVRTALFQRSLDKERNQRDKILIITHKGTLWSILARRLGLGLERALNLPVPYGAYYTFHDSLV